MILLILPGERPEIDNQTVKVQLGCNTFQQRIAMEAGLDERLNVASPHLLLDPHVLGTVLEAFIYGLDVDSNLTARECREDSTIYNWLGPGLQRKLLSILDSSILDTELAKHAKFKQGGEIFVDTEVAVAAREERALGAAFWLRDKLLVTQQRLEFHSSCIDIRQGLFVWRVSTVVDGRSRSWALSGKTQRIATDLAALDYVLQRGWEDDMKADQAM